jgi:hypothetical protein
VPAPPPRGRPRSMICRGWGPHTRSVFCYRCDGSVGSDFPHDISVALAPPQVAWVKGQLLRVAKFSVLHQTCRRVACRPATLGLGLSICILRGGAYCFTELRTWASTFVNCITRPPGNCPLTSWRKLPVTCPHATKRCLFVQGNETVAVSHR